MRISGSSAGCCACPKALPFFTTPSPRSTRGRGDVYVPWDSGAETDQTRTVRSDLNGVLVGHSTVYHAKGDAPWTEQELSRIDTIQRMMLTFLSKNRMRMMINHATLYDDAGYSNIRLFTNTVEAIGNEQGLKDFCAARIDLKHFSLINQQLGRDIGSKVMNEYIRQLEEAAGEGGIVSRLGGDNFVLLFRKQNLDRVVELLKGSPIHYGEDCRVMISARAGILVIPEDYYYHEFGDLMDRIINAYNASKTGSRAISSSPASRCWPGGSRPCASSICSPWRFRTMKYWCSISPKSASAARPSPGRKP